MLAFSVHNMIYVRRGCLEFSVTETEVYSKWSPVEGIEVETWLIPTAKGHIRRHIITSQLECTAYDCGFAYPDLPGETRSHAGGTLAVVTDSNGRSTAASEAGKAMVITSAPNTNLIFPTTIIPAIEYRIPKGRIRVETRIETDFADVKIRTGSGNGYEICS